MSELIGTLSMVNSRLRSHDCLHLIYEDIAIAVLPRKLVLISVALIVCTG